MNAALRWAWWVAITLLVAGAAAAAAVLLWWSDTTVVIGNFALYTTVPLSLVAWLLLVVGHRRAGREGRLPRAHLARYTARVAAVLLFGYAAAAGMVFWVIARVTACHVLVDNQSEQVLSHVRLVGPGCDVGLPDIAPHATGSTALSFDADGSLTIFATFGQRPVAVPLDVYVTEGLGGSLQIVVAPDGSMRVPRDER